MRCIKLQLNLAESPKYQELKIVKLFVFSLMKLTLGVLLATHQLRESGGNGLSYLVISAHITQLSIIKFNGCLTSKV